MSRPGADKKETRSTVTATVVSDIKLSVILAVSLTEFCVKYFNLRAFLMTKFERCIKLVLGSTCLDLAPSLD